MDALLWIAVIALAVLGVVGTVVPALPGAPLVLLAVIVAGWIDGFTRIGAGTILVSVLLTGLVFLTDIAATALGAKRVGASGLAVAGALLGTIIGMFFLIPGLILGPFIGAFLGEALVRRDLLQAGRVGLATWLGLVIGTVVKLGLVFAMVGLLVGRLLVAAFL